MGTVIWIGTNMYLQNGPGRPWTRQTAPAATVPYFTWDEFTPLSNAHVIGQQTLDGVPTTIVATFGTSQATPVWFTFWIDSQRAGTPGCHGCARALHDRHLHELQQTGGYRGPGRVIRVRDAAPRCQNVKRTPPVNRLERRGTRWPS